MADKQLARSGTENFGTLADDDPLAELARIVGYDNRPAVQQLQELEKHRATVRQDPVLDAQTLNLEEELLREFHFYDEPKEASAVSGQAVVEPLEDHAPAEPVADVYDDRSFDALAPIPVEPLPEQFHSDQTILAPDAAAPAEASSVDEPIFVEPETFERAARQDVSASAELSDVGVVERSGDAGWTADPWSEPAFEGVDLERELELSIGYDEDPAETPQAQAQSIDIVRHEDIALHEPFADVTIADPLVEGRGADTFVSTENPQYGEPEYEQYDDVSPSLDHGHAEMAQPAVTASVVAADQPRTVSGDVVISPMDPHGIDALLADIERFPVPPKAASVSDTARKINFPFTPTFSRATPVISNGGALSQKAFATPLSATVIPEAVALPVAETAYRPEETPIEPVVVEAAQALQPGIDEELDFDLDTFELDLSDIDLDIDPSEFEIAAQEPVLAQVPPQALIEPVYAQVDPIPEIYDIEEPVEQEIESVLPFDPSMISETEEGLAPIADLHVPQLPVVEQERHVAHQPDYDLDIDAEMAQLFGTPDRSARTTGRGLQEDQGFASQAQTASSAHISSNAVSADDDFDEFDKAMEEDFRQSLTQRRDTDSSADRLAVGSGYMPEEDYNDGEPRPVKRRLMLLAAAVAGLAIFGGVGVYAFMGDGGSVLTGGEPQIILADKSPVKVVPVDKGGKTVPNQDKAVYDRVAGAQDTTPEQGALVSSTEEPIDVVQRTLTPENLPLEGRADADLQGLTPVDDEGGDRLMPDEQTADNDAADDQQSPAVSPRKVRTMIVKPDGTLVAREEPAAQPETTVASNNATADAGDPAIKVVKTTAVTPQQMETALTPNTVPVVEQLAAQSQKSALEQAAEATVDETAPVRSVQTTSVSQTTAVPQTRPVEQPVKIVDTFKTQQPAAQPVADAKPVETASIAPGSYVIQIASLPSEAEAQKSYKTLSGKFGGVIGGKGVDIKRAEIAGKGTYFRVRIPAGTRDAANTLCARYKSAGGSCLVTR